MYNIYLKTGEGFDAIPAARTEEVSESANMSEAK